MVGLGQAKERWLCFVQCIFGQISAGEGVDEPYPNHDRQAKFDRSTPSIYLTYHNQPSGGWALAKLAGGWKGSSFLWLAKVDQNLTFRGGGGITHSQNTSSRPNLISVPGQNIQTNHNQPSGGWALAKLAGGWKGGSILWP